MRDHVLSIGADEADSSDLRFRKRLLVGIALLILPIAFIWGCIYWAVGEEAVALTPWAYTAGSIISLAVFARNRNFPFLRTAQFLLILVAPAAGAVMLGGLDDSSSVVVWSFFAPLGAVAFDRPRRAWPWFAAFVVTILATCRSRRSRAAGRREPPQRFRPDVSTSSTSSWCLLDDDVARDLRARDGTPRRHGSRPSC